MTGLDCCFVLVSESSGAFTKNPVEGWKSDFKVFQQALKPYTVWFPSDGPYFQIQITNDITGNHYWVNNSFITWLNFLSHYFSIT